MRAQRSLGHRHPRVTGAKSSQWPCGKLKPALETADIRLEPADSDDELPIAGEPGEAPP
ncbi:hypothetical protein [Cupriavidus alkaliphilus]|uniref:hypothetical protein n=1 Tax=Cupriavidus alkaliphilus TaxID=942866 RepID=UPI00160FBFAB|nr:hypothetical protein [Cupriavidus alkaliphilus]MBB2917102.1 hypothetical protein [Cupriavidus alkaliphilus]